MSRLINKTPVTRSTYRHGDLKRALLETGIMLARDGGPDAIILREVTRRVGVAPNAAYRYFSSRQELLEAVQSSALSLMAGFIEREVAKLTGYLSVANTAIAHLRAIGTGFLKFAHTESGLFRVIFANTIDDAVTAKMTTNHSDSFPSASQLFGQLFGSAFDQLIDAQVLTAEDRIFAEYFVWSALFGFATLIMNGSLNDFTHRQIEVLEQMLLDRIEKGL